MRCVILQDEPRCLKILRETSFEFVLLGWRWLFQHITNNLCILRECIHSGKIGIWPIIMGQYPILHTGRTEEFKVDWYPPKLGTCCMFPGEIPLCIRQASCMRKIAQVTSMFRSSERTVLSSLGVIFYIYTCPQKNWAFCRKQLCH